MAFDALIERVLERIAGGADARLVFGEPIVSGTRTLVPVAKVMYGLGAGIGRRNREHAAGVSGDDRDFADRGVGGGVLAKAVGALEISYAGTRFVEIGASRRLVGVFFAGIAVGLGLAAVRRRP